MRAVVVPVLALGLLFGVVARAGLITNGTFEAGSDANYPGWVISGNTGHFHINADDPHTGVSYASIGPTGSNGILTQVVTTPASVYNLTFWLSNPSGAGAGEVFQVLWNGGMVADLSAFVGVSYTFFSYSVTATGPTSTLEFDIRHDPGHWHLDDVDLNSAGVPEPGTFVLALAGLGALGLWKRRR
jgi:hypothetical protein